MKRYVFFVTFFLSCYLIQAAKTDTIEVYSNSMKKNIKAVVMTPDSYSASQKLPVIYLLHGHSGNYANGWAMQEHGTQKLVDKYNVIAVCPDGSYNSWYFDSPMDPASRYETFVSKELVNWIDKNYKTNPSRNGRGISGLSMGGHGALYLAFKHPDIFGVAGSMSGGVDIRPFPNNWEISQKLGKYSEYPENWEKNTVINMINLLTPNSLSLIIDCGTDDFFYEVNCRLHEKLLNNKIPHTFISKPGGHDWNYWENSTQYHFLFMNNFFKEKAL